MCGIAGILMPEGRSVDPNLLHRMGASIHHRGPDNFGMFLHENFALVHTRLSIVDLSAAGNQPFRRDRYVLIFNGEIYNHLLLRRTLSEEGIEVSGTSDTATLFEYLIHFGVERTLKDIRGMYAFAFCDTLVKEVFLCRDRFGIKPLYWMFSNGTLYWGSEVKAIGAVSTCTVNVTRALFSAAAGTENSVYLTPFQDVFNVSPGHYLRAVPGRAPESREYYNITEQVDESVYRELDRCSHEAILERFEGALKRSVKSLLMSDAPMGCFVSGGIDSSLITALALEENQSLSLFTANILGRYSEFGDAKFLSESLRRPLYDVPFEPGMLLDGWARATWHSEVPLVAHVNSIPFSYVALLARSQGVKAVLTGEGSDELFLGYPKLLARRWKPWAAFPVHALMGLYGVIPKLRDYLFPRPGQSIETFLWRVVRQFEREFIDQTATSTYHFLPKHNAIEHYLTIQMFRSSLHSLLHRNDRMGMLASIESRFPFLDEAVVEFAVNLPTRFKIGRSWRLGNFKHPFSVDKWIVRETARRRLPRRLVDKPKLGFPLYGHQHLKLGPGFFRDGFLDQALGMSGEMEEYILHKGNPYFAGKLASIEVFGRLFGLSQSESEVTEHLLQFARVETG